MTNTQNLPLTNLIAPFLHNLDAMRESLQPLMIMAYAMNRSASREHKDALEKFGTLIEETDEVTKYDVPLEHSRRVSKKSRRHSQSKRAMTLLPRLMLISFVNEYDAFLGRLISQLHQHRPELLKSSERSLSISELMEFNSFVDAQRFLIEREIESVLRRSHVDQFSWMEERFGTTLTKGLERFSMFVELTERRNLYVHTDGVVSTQYLKNCSRNNVDIKKTHVGDTLEVDREYLGLC